MLWHFTLFHVPVQAEHQWLLKETSAHNDNDTMIKNHTPGLLELLTHFQGGPAVFMGEPLSENPILGV